MKATGQALDPAVTARRAAIIAAVRRRALAKERRRRLVAVQVHRPV